MAVMLTDVSDRGCEELDNLPKKLKKARASGQESKVNRTTYAENSSGHAK